MGEGTQRSAYIVTGTTRGIGKALADDVIRRGHLLFSISRAPDSKAGRGQNFCCDLGKPAQVERTVEKLAETLPLASIERLVLINNAGVLEPIGPLVERRQEQIERIIRINLVAPTYLMAAVLRISRSFKGKRGIINISSGAAHSPYAGWSLYCASKAGLEMVTACAALERRESERHLYIAAVAPGVVETGMQEAIRKTGESDFPMRSKFVAMHEEGRLDSPVKVAEMLLDLDLGGQFDAGGIYDLRDVVWKAGAPTISGTSV